MAASPMPCLGPKRERKCYATHAFSGVPNTKRGEQNQKWSPTKGNKIRSGCHILALSGAKREAGWATSPLHSWGSPTKGNTIISGCLTHALSGAQKRAKMLRHPCILGGPQHQARGAKSEVVTNKREQNQKWLPHPRLVRGPKEGENATSPLHSRRSPTPSAGSNITSGAQQR